MQNLSNNPAQQIITYPDDIMLHVTQSKATLIIQRVAKANNTFKSPSPEGSQSIPLLCPQLETPTGTLCLGTNKRHDSTLNLFTPFPLCHPCLLPSPNCPESSQRVERECSRTEENWSDKDSRPSVQICLHIEGPRLLCGQRP